MGNCSSRPPPPNPNAVDLTHFELLKVVGKGGFGKVNAITKLDTGELMALKRMEKFGVLQSSAHLRMVWTERKIMSMIESPFLCHLNYAFENDKELFLVMPFMQGGDLRFHLRERGCMTVEQARFYAAELILGLEDMHRRRIVYRDLKPENILLDDAGHLRVSDFGLASILDEKNRFQTTGQAGCLEESERILLANGEPIVISQIPEDPAQWPLLLSETGEPQRIDRVYRGTADYLYSIRDSTGSYLVTEEHRLAFQWLAPSARVEIDSEQQRVVLHYYSQEDNDIFANAITLRYGPESSQYNELPRDRTLQTAEQAELRVWEEYLALPDELKIREGDIVMVTITNYNHLNQDIKYNLKEYIVNIEDIKTQKDKDINHINTSINISTANMKGESEMGMGMGIEMGNEIPLIPVSYSSFEALRYDSVLGFMPVDLSAHSSAATSMTVLSHLDDSTLQSLSFLLRCFSQSSPDHASSVSRSLFVSPSSPSSSASELLSSLVSRRIPLLVLTGSAEPDQWAELALNLPSLTLISSFTSVEGIEERQYHYNGHSFRVRFAPTPTHSSSWPAFSTAFLAPLNSLSSDSPSCSLPSPVCYLSNTLAKVSKARPVDVKQVRRPDGQKYRWVGVEVADARHRVVLPSGSVTGNTRGYQSPEVITDQWYGVEVDYWSYGITVYELLHGVRPWKDWTTVQHLYHSHQAKDGNSDGHKQAIMDAEGVASLKEPFHISSRLDSVTHDFLRALLNIDFKQRLGCGPGGFKEIKAHPFFSSINWDRITAKSEPGPVSIDSQRANCSADADLADQLLDRKPRPITPEQQLQFKGWNYRTEIVKTGDPSGVLSDRGRSSSVKEDKRKDKKDGVSMATVKVEVASAKKEDKEEKTQSS